MTEADLLACAGAALAKWQPRLHLMDWTLRISVKTLGEGIQAKVDETRREHKALITLCPDMHAKNAQGVPYDADILPAEQLVEENVLHELLHVVGSPSNDALRREAEWMVGKKGLFGETLRTAVEDHEEWWVSHVCRVLLEADRSGGWFS